MFGRLWGSLDMSFSYPEENAANKPEAGAVNPPYRFTAPAFAEVGILETRASGNAALLGGQGVINLTNLGGYRAPAIAGD